MTWSTCFPIVNNIFCGNYSQKEIFKIFYSKMTSLKNSSQIDFIVEKQEITQKQIKTPQVDM